jgi:TPR repeat protein
MRPRFLQLTASAALAIGLSTVSVPVFAQDDNAFEKGVAAFEVGKYQDAITLWEPLAEEGNVDALRNLAQMYRLGLGVEQDDEKAYDLYRQAANLGSDQAQVNIAFQLLTGKGVEQDRSKAAAWFARAADAGNPLAQYNLGLMYEKGIGVERNEEFATELYRVAASQGQRRAIARLEALENAPAEEKAQTETAQADEEKAGNDAAKADSEADAKMAAADEKNVEKMPAYTSEADSSDAGSDSRREIDVVRTPMRKPGETVADASKGDEPAEITIPDDANAKADADGSEKQQNSSFSFSSAGSEAAGDASKTASTGVKKDYSETKDKIAEAMTDRASDEEKPGKDYSETRSKIGDAIAAASGDGDTSKDYSATKSAIGDAMAARSETAGEMEDGGASSASKSNAMATARIPSDPVARVKLAEQAYRNGDFGSAAMMLEPLSNAGMPIAQFWMGRMHNRGEGVSQDRTLAYSLWRSAASAGSNRAATALANLASRLSAEEISVAEQAHLSSVRAR